MHIARLLPIPSGQLTLVLHASGAWLGLAHPDLALARAVASPAARRYLVGWAGAGELHMLAPSALARRASTVSGSREFLDLIPTALLARIALAHANRALPPPHTPARAWRYARWMWLADGAAQWASGQTAHARPLVARHLRERPRPSFPPGPREAYALGGTVFDVVEAAAGRDACLALATTLDPAGGRAALTAATGQDAARVERAWRAHLDELRG